jgi:PPP family 3-phenylpropionic acid transporter
VEIPLAAKPRLIMKLASDTDADSFQSLLLVTLVLHVFYPALMPALDSACGVLVQHNEAETCEYQGAQKQCP